MNPVPVNKTPNKKKMDGEERKYFHLNSFIQLQTAEREKKWLAQFNIWKFTIDMQTKSL